MLHIPESLVQLIIGKTWVDIIAKTLAGIGFLILCAMWRKIWGFAVKLFSKLKRKKEPEYNEPIAFVVKGDQVTDLIPPTDGLSSKHKLVVELSSLYRRSEYRWNNDAHRMEDTRYAMKILTEIAEGIDRIIPNIKEAESYSVKDYLRSLSYRIKRMRPVHPDFSSYETQAVFWAEGDSILKNLETAAITAEK